MTAVQLKVTLVGIEPPIWRRVLVDGSVSLADLHEILQIAVGWEQIHSHAFEIGGKRYVDIEEDDPEADEFDEQDAVIERVFAAAREGRYEYDFGDDWQHHVLVEDTFTVPVELALAVCLGGERSCPPEDCGGSYGYANLLEAISDPGHEEFDEYIEWVGKDFDPEEFSLATTNAILQKLR